MSENTPTSFQALLRLLRYASGYRRRITLASLCSMLNKLFDVMPEILIGIAIDVVVRQQDSFVAELGVADPKWQMLLLAGLTLLIWMGESLFEYLHLVMWRNLAQDLQHAMRLDAYTHVQRLDLAYFEDRSTGNLVSILNDDVNQLERFFNGGANSDPRPESTEDGFNPKVTLAYDVNDEMMVYALASRGFRYGGINGAIPESVCADELEQVERQGGDVPFFEPDSLWNYELGTKGTGAGGALSYSASYFLIKWDDMQTSRSFECGFGFRENVGKATSQGVELELHAAVTDRWLLGFGGAYINSELDQDVPNLNAVKGDQVPYVPEFSFSASSDYSFPMGDSLEGLFWANVQYIGTRHTEFNHDPNTNYRKMDDYTVANARFSVLWNDFDFSFYMHNVFDNDGVVRALRRPPFDPDAVIRTQPRTIGLMVRKNF